MNLFPAELSGERDITCEIKAWMRCGGSTDARRGAAGQEVPFFIGVRPEHIAASGAGTSTAWAEVEFVEPLGETTNLISRSEAARFLAVSGRSSVQAGASVGVIAHSEHLRVVEGIPRSAAAKG